MDVSSGHDHEEQICAADLAAQHLPLSLFHVCWIGPQSKAAESCARAATKIAKV